MKNISAVLFDLDGVLVDACDWHYEALNKALIYSGYPAINEIDHINKFNGLPTKVKLHMLNVPLNKIEEINSLKQKYTIEIINNTATTMNEKIELHKFLHSMGIKIACVTNSIKHTAELMLEKTGQLKYIDLLISNEDVQKNKPSPDCYNKAVSYWNLKKSECLCVEDSDKGIQAVINSMIDNLWIVKNTHEVTLEGYVKYMEKNK
jgi:beta-phosphoglucomutase